MELEYKKLISNELSELESNLSSSVSSEIELATEVSSYLLIQEAKNKTCYMYLSCKSLWIF